MQFVCWPGWQKITNLLQVKSWLPHCAGGLFFQKITVVTAKYIAISSECVEIENAEMNFKRCMKDEPRAEVEEMKHFEAENGIHNCSKDKATSLVMLSA